MYKSGMTASAFACDLPKNNKGMIYLLHFKEILTNSYNISAKALQKLYSEIKEHVLVQYIILALCAVFFSEIFNRRSFKAAIDFAFNEFAVFLVGFFMVLALLSLIHLLKKRNFWKYIVSLGWVIISIISFIMFSFRLMPFSFNDLLLLPNTFTILPRYLSVFQFILFLSLIVFACYGVVWLYRATKPKAANLKKDAVFSVIILCISVTYFAVAHSTGVIDKRVTGLMNKYERNGFIYCYASSVFERGMSQPDDYSSVEVASIVRDVNKRAGESKIEANIIFLQLESFFDVNNVKEFSYSENPIPVFNSLEQKYSHGYLDVPTFSAGTANTEFEVLSGLNVDFLGIGEVAYRSVVNSKPIETVCHTLKKYGYSTHAIHNNNAAFYNRKMIYRNLGFDTFTSLEYMYDVEYNPLGWACDKVLTSSIVDCMKSTDTADMIYAVGVQGHGTYPSDMELHEDAITVEGIENPDTKARYEYYISQMKEVDSFVGELVSTLEAINEPTVLVIFGDHMPGFDVEDDELLNDSKYQTQYVIWSNFESDCIIKDLQSYQLYSYVLDRLNIDGGTVSKLHKQYSYSKSDEYLSKLEIVQYDMLEGDGLSYGNSPPNVVDTKMGIRPISVSRAYADGEDLIVEGNNFNEFSRVVANDKLLKTEYFSANRLVVRGFTPNDEITQAAVAQADENSYVLSATPYVEIE